MYGAVGQCLAVISQIARLAPRDDGRQRIQGRVPQRRIARTTRQPAPRRIYGEDVVCDEVGKVTDAVASLKKDGASVLVQFRFSSFVFALVNHRYPLHLRRG
jgi:hypothetical protein